MKSILNFHYVIVLWAPLNLISVIVLLKPQLGAGMSEPIRTYYSFSLFLIVYGIIVIIYTVYSQTFLMTIQSGPSSLDPLPMIRE